MHFEIEDGSDGLPSFKTVEGSVGLSNLAKGSMAPFAVLANGSGGLFAPVDSMDLSVGCAVRRMLLNASSSY